MKQKLLVLLILTFTVGIFHNASGQTKTEKHDMKTFLEHSDECLDRMVNAANEMSVKGACVIAFIPGDVSVSWISKMKIAGALQNGSANFLGIAYTKAAEMADTFKDSGSGVREPLHGEFGYQGGAIMKIGSGYILAVFSGASGEQDFEIAKTGLDCLSKYY